MWNKRISEVTDKDVRDVATRQMSEGLSVEFKREFSGGSNTPAAKKALAKEITALANSYGGTLILGMGEDSSKRASAIYPIADCRREADDLSNAVPAIIDPPIPGFECEGIETDGAGGGVIVMRVPQSIVGPHWVTEKAGGTTGTCYVRRNTASVPASMRDIHQLVLSRENARGRVEVLLSDAEERAKAFSDWAHLEAAKGVARPIGAHRFSIAAVPLSPMQVPFLTSRTNGRPNAERFDPVGAQANLNLPTTPEYFWRTKMRRIENRRADVGRAVMLEECEDGTITTSFVMLGGDQHGDRTHGNWLVAAFACSLVRIERARREAGAPEAEYVLRARLDAETKLRFYPAAGTDRFDTYEWPSGSSIFPDYVIGPPSTFDDALELFDRDVQNAAGQTWPTGIKVDWEKALKTVLTS